MANICLYKIKVKGSKKACYKLVDMMPLYSGEKEYISEDGTDEDFTLVFTGDCKWSVDCYTKFEKDLKPYTEEELDKVFKNDDGLDISKYAEELVKENRKAQNRMCIDDIMAISLGMYKTYDDYVKSKQQIIEDANEMNRNTMIFNSNYLKFTYYVQPLIIDKNTFDYIVGKYGDKK